MICRRCGKDIVGTDRCLYCGNYLDNYGMRRDYGRPVSGYESRGAFQPRGVDLSDRGVGFEPRGLSFEPKGLYDKPTEPTPAEAEVSAEPTYEPTPTQAPSYESAAPTPTVDPEELYRFYKKKNVFKVLRRLLMWVNFIVAATAMGYWLSPVVSALSAGREPSEMELVENLGTLFLTVICSSAFLGSLLCLVDGLGLLSLGKLFVSRGIDPRSLPLERERGSKLDVDAVRTGMCLAQVGSARSIHIFKTVVQVITKPLSALISIFFYVYLTLYLGQRFFGEWREFFTEAMEMVLGEVYDFVMSVDLSFLSFGEYALFVFFFLVWLAWEGGMGILNAMIRSHLRKWEKNLPAYAPAAADSRASYGSASSYGNAPSYGYAPPVTNTKSVASDTYDPMASTYESVSHRSSWNDAEPAPSPSDYPMKWYKFLKVILFLGALANAFSAISSFATLGFAGLLDYVTASILLYVIYSFGSGFCLCVMALLAWRGLRDYRRVGPKRVTRLYSFNIVFVIINTLIPYFFPVIGGLGANGMLELELSINAASSVGAIIMNAIMIAVNRAYFKTREALFVN